MPEVVAQPPPVSLPGQDFLTIFLNTLLKEYASKREPQEAEFVRNYQDRMRIARAGDTSGTGAPAANKARPLFMGLTRSKIRTARARIKKTLFRQGTMPFDFSPVDDRFKPHTEAFEKIVLGQFREMGYKGVIGRGTNGVCTYGTDYIAGPFKQTRAKPRLELDPRTGAIRETMFQYDIPVYEHARAINVFPDPEAADTQLGRGTFWTDYISVDRAKQLAANKRYRNVAQAIAAMPSAGTDRSHGQFLLEDARANIQYYTRDGRIALIRFFGKLPRAALTAWQQADAVPPQFDVRNVQTEEVEASVVLLGGMAVRAEVSPWRHRPIRRCVYEEEEGEHYGTGIARNNEPNQRMINAASRLFMEAKGFALLGMWDIDRSKFSPKETFKFFPGKVFERAPGVTTQEAEQALRQITFEDVSDGWLLAVQLAERFSDDDTGISKFSQGNDARFLNNTATGISLIMGASNVPLEEVMENIDEMWLQHHVDELIEWDLKFLEPETVAVLHDDKTAQLWAQIKQFGKASFMTWRPIGSALFVRNEIMLQKLQGYLALVLSNERATGQVDIRDLLDQLWELLNMQRKSPVLDEETIAQLEQFRLQSPQAQTALRAGQARIAKDLASARKLEADATATVADSRRAEGEGGDLAEIKALLRELMANLNARGADNPPRSGGRRNGRGNSGTRPRT